ncbi:hypothetical protein [Bradyrhizobium australiense]|uniref:hypothetical protein n=1 Tax=Bradyrhizobium australiense TaxID=2721161 RepID=UPI0035D8EDB5
MASLKTELGSVKLPALNRERLIEFGRKRAKQLRMTMDENITRLRAAIEASQRRIDAVMAAIREQISDNSPYGSNGRVKGQMASYARNVQI